ncbi:hypothetical protein GCM10022393_18970 [Aquimarina addita]|uniref:Uncharacterized protein n=1 Tax=Aquimarina addita TaxID=870485 RepID=A0ABP6UIV8_9FLAO
MSKENPNTENTVSSETGAEWTAAWRKRHPNACKAFLIPAVDLIEVLNEMNILTDKVAAVAQKRAKRNQLNIRGYMAIGAEPPSEEKEERILLVGTKEIDGVYRDIIDGEIDGKPVLIDVDGAELLISSGIYDATSPCPPVCDSASPLN